MLMNLWVLYGERIIFFGVIGLAGGFAKALVERKGILFLPQVWCKDGKKGIDLGILSSMILGAVVSIVVDGSGVTAFSVALCAPYVIEQLIKRTQPPK